MFKHINTQEAEALLSDKEVVVIDVRDIDSYKENHIPGAKHMSAMELVDFCETHELSKPVLVYCYKGISCQSVAQHLVEEGFKDVYSLIGGFEAWKAHSSSNNK